MAAVGAGGIVGVVAAVLVAALPHGEGFNVHPAPHRVLTHGGRRSFGHRVLQLQGSRIMVGAPAEVGEGGRLFQCLVETGECREVEVEGNSTQTHMGMALARDGDITIACGPGLTRECDRNVYTSGLCLLLDPQLKLRQVLAPGYQGCLPGKVDLVFLFDGSNSMSPEQFDAIRDFMVDVMEKLENTSIRFGAVQFSAEVRLQFTLADYAARPRPRELFAGLKQLRSLTDTFAAIDYVVKTIFTPEKGARAGAKRVLIIITDGDATDQDRGSIREAEERDIIRYIIGVGNNFGSPDTRLYLSQFASHPSSEFVKVLDSFEKLRGLFRELQAKIYDIEGTSDLNRFHLELCSSGMSVEAVQGRWVTGAVGADNWAGGLVELEDAKANETFVASPSLEENVTDTYLGYAVAGLRVPNRVLVAAGAPRHRHVGSVVLFEVPEATGSWRVLQTLPGEQVGSYFGATLCALEQGGVTVALLVGAPNHFDGRRGGRVHVYRWQKDALEVAEELRGAPGHPLGRFGASVATLGDLDGDAVPEVAVGAPMEDEERGVVYVFSGRPGGVEPRYGQRLEGRAAAGLRFFGQALDGAMDLTGDGLVDLVVGAEGHVVVLRSRPVITVTPHVTFDPPEIPTARVDCSGVAGANVTVGLCFDVRRVSRAYTGELETSLDFRLEVDPQRARGRGDFGAGRRAWHGRLSVTEGQSCKAEELKIPPCLEDFVTPIRISVTVSLPHGDPRDPLLPPNNPPTWTEIPFEKNCGADEVCEADLGVAALPGEPAVLGVAGAEFGVRLVVGNKGEDAYGAALQLQHPAGLSLRRARATQATAPVSIACWDPDVSVGQPWGALTCNISRPVLRAGWQVTVELTFDILQNTSWNESAPLTATAGSDNEPPAALEDNEVAWVVPVRFALGLVATWQEDSTPYLNFTSRHPENKNLHHRYRLDTILPPPHGSPPPRVTAFVLLPHALPHGVTVADPQVRTESGSACDAVGQEEEDAVGQELRRNIAETCSTPELRLFRCPPAQLAAAGSALLLTATLLAPPTIQSPARPRFCSALWVAIAPPRFEVNAQFLRAQGVTEVELIREVDALPVYVGGGVGGLLLLLIIIFGLFKCGFFKRNYRERLDQEGEGQGEGVGEGEGEGEGSGEDTPP
ncbi:integrin alpha-L isoform X1 [Buteo buteo]|uniref:integrin alpha-L isoform X1 n=2 Tax=Buteo buteo TaxID=30397 RepID=UPI003EBD9F02